MASPHQSLPQAADDSFPSTGKAENRTAFTVKRNGKRYKPEPSSGRRENTAKRCREEPACIKGKHSVYCE